MRLTTYSDYALRVLLYLAARPDRLCSIQDIATAYGISRNHLMKVVNDLTRAGYVTGVRGRAGGLKLARPAAGINVGAVIRHTEHECDLVGCGDCLLGPACGLTDALDEALAAFFAVLDRYTLADVIARRPARLLKLLQASGPASQRAR